MGGRRQTTVGPELTSTQPPSPGEVEAGQWSMAGRGRTAIASSEPARAVCVEPAVVERLRLTPRRLVALDAPVRAGRRGRRHLGCSSAGRGRRGPGAGRPHPRVSPPVVDGHASRAGRRRAGRVVPSFRSCGPRGSGRRPPSGCLFPGARPPAGGSCAAEAPGVGARGAASRVRSGFVCALSALSCLSSCAAGVGVFVRAEQEVGGHPQLLRGLFSACVCASSRGRSRSSRLGSGRTAPRVRQRVRTGSARPAFGSARAVCRGLWSQSGIVGVSLALGVASFFDSSRVSLLRDRLLLRTCRPPCRSKVARQTSASWEPSRLVVGAGSSFDGIGSVVAAPVAVSPSMSLTLRHARHALL